MWHGSCKGSSMTNHSMVPVLWLMLMPVFDKKSAPKMTLYLKSLSNTNAFCCSTTLFLSRLGSLIERITTISCDVQVPASMLIVRLGLYWPCVAMSRQTLLANEGAWWLRVKQYFQQGAWLHCWDVAHHHDAQRSESFAVGQLHFILWSQLLHSVTWANGSMYPVVSDLWPDTNVYTKEYVL